MNLIGNNDIIFYIIISENVRLFVCLYGYRLDSWKCYSLVSGIIRTIMTRGVQREKKFPKIDQLAKLQKKKIHKTNAFQWENFIT